MQMRQNELLIMKRICISSEFAESSRFDNTAHQRPGAISDTSQYYHFEQNFRFLCISFIMIIRVTILKNFPILAKFKIFMN